FSLGVSRLYFLTSWPRCFIFTRVSTSSTPSSCCSIPSDLLVGPSYSLSRSSLRRLTSSSHLLPVYSSFHPPFHPPLVYSPPAPSSRRHSRVLLRTYPRSHRSYSSVVRALDRLVSPSRSPHSIPAPLRHSPSSSPLLRSTYPCRADRSPVPSAAIRSSLPCAHPGRDARSPATGAPPFLSGAVYSVRPSSTPPPSDPAVESA